MILLFFNSSTNVSGHISASLHVRVWSMRAYVCLHMCLCVGYMRPCVCVRVCARVCLMHYVAVTVEVFGVVPAVVVGTVVAATLSLLLIMVVLSVFPQTAVT